MRYNYTLNHCHQHHRFHHFNNSTNFLMSWNNYSKNTEFRFKDKPKNLLNELRGFKFVIILVLKFKRVVNKNETKHSLFIRKQK